MMIETVRSENTDSLNNCNTCDHKRYPESGHCYMFKIEPVAVCMQHTFIKSLVRSTVSNVFHSVVPKAQPLPPEKQAKPKRHSKGIPPSSSKERQRKQSDV